MVSMVSFDLKHFHVFSSMRNTPRINHNQQWPIRLLFLVPISDNIIYLQQKWQWKLGFIIRNEHDTASTKIVLTNCLVHPYCWCRRTHQHSHDDIISFVCHVTPQLARRQVCDGIKREDRTLGEQTATRTPSLPPTSPGYHGLWASFIRVHDIALVLSITRAYHRKELILTITACHRKTVQPMTKMFGS